ncbi:hypothetical protein ACH5RR_011335 [Cinchona calisaya]|uniref:3-beta hydroxysteroid dehydrogenase/isomerase domain-containing protein n=1 Tax=Cinchona calisaya TaxID=153742 RepID=A0ABD3A4L1_9GENT
MKRCKEVVALASLSIEPRVPKAGENGKCVGNNNNNAFACNLYSRERKIVCVTSANSYFGAHLTKKLLARGYLVRVTIQNPVNYEDMKEFMREEEISQLQSVVVAKMGDAESLCDAFRGCHAIFHTSSFIDPRGVTGYTERMAFLETEGARNVIEACGRAAYVKRCIFTSSLLATIWTGNENIGPVKIDESCWSNEEFCRENKLWLALGKTRSEKVAWRRSRELKVNLVTLCPGLLMAPSFPNAHIETSIPYLKGGQIMLKQGILATEDVNKVAEAHVFVYEDMDYGACGRYICYGKIITRLEEAIQLESRLKMHGLLSGENDEIIPPNLSNSKLTRLLDRASRRVSCKLS